MNSTPNSHNDDRGGLMSDGIDAIMNRLTGSSKAEAQAAVDKLQLPVSKEERKGLFMLAKHILQRMETDWEPLTKDDWPALNIGGVCPRCNDHYRWSPPAAYGKTTGAYSYDSIKNCMCALHKAVNWHIQYAIPKRYREIKLNTIQPSDKSFLSIETQQWLYTEVQKDPECGLAIFGPVGTSKTTICLALLRHLIVETLKSLWFATEHVESFLYSTKRWRLPIERISAKQLLLEHHDYVINRPVTNAEGYVVGGAKEPTVTRGIIESWAAKGQKFRLFLEEIDKVELTQARRDVLFDIVNALYDAEGQLVFNTNLTKSAFHDLYGAEFARRIKEMCKRIDLFSEGRDIK